MELILKLITAVRHKKAVSKLRGILKVCSVVFSCLLLSSWFYTQAFAADPDFFGQEAGNEFNYQGWEYGYGSYTLKETVYLDTSTFAPTTTYKTVSKFDGEYDGELWFEKGSGVLKLRGLRLWDEEDGWLTFKFSSGLPWAWYPVKQIGYNESNSTTMTVNQISGFNVSIDVTVLLKESVALGFDTLEAYKMKYILTMSGNGLYEQVTLYQWQVSYIGTIKYTDDECEETLTSFNIGGGTITQNTDTDGDGLKDYRELAVYTTNRESSDTDGDNMPDGWEVTYGLDPTANDASSDKDNDGYSNLQEYQSGTDPTDPEDYPGAFTPTPTPTPTTIPTVENGFGIGLIASISVISMLTISVWISKRRRK